MDYLAAQGMNDFTAVTLDTVNAYIRTLAGFSYKTVEQHICSLHIRDKRQFHGLSCFGLGKADFFLRPVEVFKAQVLDICAAQPQTTNSTAVYLKVDMERLAECPLDFEEVIRLG